MSLLMEALRKAEQQKQQALSEDSPAPAESDKLELAPLPEESPPAQGSPAVGGDRLPELPTRLEDLDEQFLAHELAPPSTPRPATAGKTGAPPRATPPSRPQAASSDTSPRETARNVFAAKQPAPTKNRHGFAIAVGGLTFLAVVAIGGYFYWQLQPKSGLSVGPTLTAPAPAVTPVPAPPAQPAVAAPALPTPATTPAEQLRQQPAAPILAARPEPREPPASRPAATAAATDSSIHLSPSSARRIDPALERAQQAFNRGEADLARTAWQAALRTDPRNADALHGLAALAQQDGQSAQAVDYYLQALEADPKDALAVAALASFSSAANIQQTESRLKTLLAEQPDSPYLNFALGNLHAQAARWAEAQQAYFKAHAADATNPDYLYNLAVSLDHLHQTKLAAQYYARALDAANRQIAGFDRAQTAQRLKMLQE